MKEFYLGGFAIVPQSSKDQQSIDECGSKSEQLWFQLNKLLNAEKLTRANGKNILDLHVTISQVIRGLSKIGLHVSNESGLSIMLTSIVKSKLDDKSLSEFVDKQDPDKLTKLDTMMDFLHEKGDRLYLKEELGKLKPLYGEIRNCLFCDRYGHVLKECQKFTKRNVKENVEWCKNENICTQCLERDNSSHYFYCKISKCEKCGEYTHHTLLHDSEEIITKVIATSVMKYNNAKRENYFQTISLDAFDQDCNPLRSLALLSSESTVTRVTRAFARKLQIPIWKKSRTLKGNGNLPQQKSCGTIMFDIAPHFGGQTMMQVMAYVVNKINYDLEDDILSNNVIKKTLHSKLANPHYYIPNKVDIMLDVSIYECILQKGRKRFNSDIIGLKTTFGWVIKMDRI